MIQKAFIDKTRTLNKQLAFFMKCGFQPVQSVSMIDSIVRHAYSLSPEFNHEVFFEQTGLYALSNGGFYYAPLADVPDMGTLLLQSPNGFESRVSFEAACITATLFALSHLSFRDESYGQYYHLLRDYVLGIDDESPAHPEAELICYLID